MNPELISKRAIASVAKQSFGPMGLLCRLPSARSGYIAVTSAILLSFLILIISATLAFSTYVNRFNVFDSQTKETSLALAEACVDIALLKLAQNPSYAGGEDFTISGQKCSVVQITAAGQTKTIITNAAQQGAISRVKAVINQSSSIAVVSWEEL